MPRGGGFRALAPRHNPSATHTRARLGYAGPDELFRRISRRSTLPRRSGSRPGRPAAPSAARSSGSSSTTARSSSAPSTARTAAGTARRRPTPPSPSTSIGGASRPPPSRPTTPARSTASQRRAEGEVRRRLGASLRSMLQPHNFADHAPPRTRCLTDEGPVVATFDEFKHQLPGHRPGRDPATGSTSLDQVVDQEGESRARFLVYKLLKRARQLHVGLPPLTQTRYINTISPEQEPFFPGDERARAADPPAHPLERGRDGPPGEQPVHRDRRPPRDVRLARPACTRSGFNHFFKGKDDGQAAATRSSTRATPRPGIYARAFLEGRLTEDQLDHFRRETVPGEGLRSYPHPRLMPDFWEFPTVSMGIGPDQRGLPGPVQPLPPEPRPAGHVRVARLGVPRRRRDRRARDRSGRSTSPPARASTT